MDILILFFQEMEKLNKKKKRMKKLNYNSKQLRILKIKENFIGVMSHILNMNLQREYPKEEKKWEI